MPGIIKAGEFAHREGVSASRFNLDDVTEKAHRYLEQVRGEAATIVAKARAEADEIRKRAEQEGLQQGMQSAERLLSQRIEQQLAAAVPALDKAVDGIRAARDEVYWDRNLVALAMGIARNLVRREMELDREIALTWVREALELASRGNRLRLRINPRDQQLLGEHLTRLVARTGREAATEVVADESISTGGCKVETEFGEVDLQLESQLARLAEELQ